ncbi:MAG TPA: DegQ family serine endoprotease [Patescibacteria group bacterium]|nr:DegQ family serine endoprotease [Patescibacteria group bacterium]
MTRSLDGNTQRRRARLMVAILAGAALGGGAAYAETTSAPAPLQLAPVVNQAGFSELVTKVKPAVVNIATSEMPQQTRTQEMPEMPPDFPFPDMFRHFFDHNQGSGPEHALGSGFVIDAAGYIVTNNHVIDGAHKITVTLDDGRSLPAKVVGRDTKTDLALLKVEAGKPLPYLAFGDSGKENVGDWVVAVGNPFGLGGTVTAGIVSAHGRNINEGPYDDFLQIDAPINPGNSGGPLFNQSGQVIGIDTAIYSPSGGSVGIGFAIPSDLASQVVAQLREHGKVERGWLGVQMQPITPALAKALGLAKDEGVLVNNVMADSPAEKAKLQQGDVITAYDGAAIKTPRDLAVAVAKTHAGDAAKLTLWRQGRDVTAEVNIAALPKDQTETRTEDADGGHVGMALAPLSNDERSQLGLGPSAKGVVVAQITPGSPANDSGIEAGDVIVRVNDTPVTTPRQAIAKITEAQKDKKEAVPLLVTRNGTTYYIALELAQG